MMSVGMEPGEYSALIAAAQTGNIASQIELLQSMRTNKVRQPELAVLYGGRLLSECPRKLGDEIWTVYEQVFMAAIELGADQWRDHCLKKLTTKFPSSVRVERLKGIYQESLHKWSEAKKIYDGILAEKPEDTLTSKRLITMYKQQGRTAEAVDAINKYLETFPTDTEVWHELATLYIEVGTLQRAVFCFEELLLANPRSMYNVLTYAELCHSTGDLEMSRKYFSLACYIDGACLRALWGLYTVSLDIERKEKDKANISEKMQQLTTFAAQRLKAVYKEKGMGSHAAVALALLDAWTEPVAAQ